MRAIIIDDEVHCTRSLNTMLERYTHVEVIQIFTDPLEAVKTLRTIDAEILFIDIEMPFLNGFELLNLFPDMPWKVIFTTAYDSYAVKAFKVNAIDYLLKPIAKTELINAIAKCNSNNGKSNADKIVKSFHNEFHSRVRKVAIPTLAGLELVNPENISHLESESNYTRVHLSSGETLLVSKTLKFFESQLEIFGFVRVHHSFIVNVAQIKRYVRGDGGYVIMDRDNTHINVSRSRKDALLQLIQPENK